jgi:xylan 1,4-beta-xylosidase
MMRRALALLFLLAWSPASASDAVFAYFSYTGSDPVEAAMPLNPGQYRNPVKSGFHPDPSIVRVGKDYYLVNSTFAFYPGLTIYHSRDLVSWEAIGHAIDRPDMFDFTGLGIARAIFAPTIRFHNGLFYIINTCIECGLNFVTTAKNPAGPWSDPVFLKPVDGIDPDLFFDSDGRAWIANNGPPIGEPQYDGHRAIWIQEFDWHTLTMFGPRRMIINGGVKFSEKPIWTEGPHIFKRDGWYYLIAAEGGTAENHSETVFRSRKVTGPYVPGPVNPILTQRDLSPDRPFPVYATGHADFVQTPGGDWWSVFLGTRPYEVTLSNLGRETFLLPVRWPKGGWPTILPQGAVVPQSALRPKLPLSRKAESATVRDDFTAPTLSAEWLMLRTPKIPWYRLTPHALTLSARPVSISSTENPSFLAQRQRHNDATITTSLRFEPTQQGDQAGLVVFADERHHFFFGVRKTSTGPMIVVTRRNGESDPLDGTIIASTPYAAASGLPIKLRVRIHGATVDFSYANADGADRTLLGATDGRMLASDRSNQFTGAVVGVYAGRTAE